MNKKILLLFLLLFLTACQESNLSEDNTSIQIDAYNDTNYSVEIPFDLSGARKWHGDYLSKLDQIEIPKGLQEYSKDYFDVADNFVRQGSLLDDDDVKMLQRRESDEYPYALNPELGAFEVDGTTTIESPYIVYDVVELDFVNQKTDELSGISLAIIMNSTVTSDGEEYSLSDDRLYTFASVSGRKLELYLRTKEEVDPDLPNDITFYAASDANSYVPGHYIGEGLFEGRSGQFSEISEQWLLVPSTAFSSYDTTLASSISEMKSAINSFLPENVSMIGYAKYQDNDLSYLKINIVMQAKTYTEMYALAQYVNELSQSFINNSFELVIMISQNDEAVFSITKPQGESQTTVNDLT